MLPTFKSFYNNTLKTLKESVDLDSLPIFQDPTTIHNHITIENGEKVIKGSIDFSYKNLTELPDLSDVKVLGVFYCGFNQLQTLEGSPKYVVGDFYCSDNQLQTLKGSPEYVGSYFDCSNNPQLTTLKGLPKYIGGDLFWYYTKVPMEDFYENLLLSDVKGNPMARIGDEDEVGYDEYPEEPMSREEVYSTAKAYKFYNTPSEDIDF
jgi:hypothetical protein